MIRIALVIVLALLTGCETSRQKKAQQERVELEHTRIRTNLREAVRLVIYQVERAGQQINAAIDEKISPRDAASRARILALKKDNVTMRIRVAESVRDALWVANPVVGFTDVWAFVLQLEQYVKNGEGRKKYAEFHEIVADAMGHMVEGVEAIAHRALTDKQFAEAREKVSQFANKNPLIEGMARSPSDDVGGSASGWFDWVPSFNPFSGVGEGLGEGAEAIAQFNQTAERFTDVVEFLPHSIAWRLELLQYELEETLAIASVVDGVNNAASAADALAKAAEQLPHNVRAEAQAALEALDPRLERLSATLKDLTNASESLDDTGVTYAETASKIQGMASQLATTLETFNKTYILLDGDPNAPPEPEPVEPGPPSRPFDVLDYSTTAQSIMGMAAQLGQTLDTFNALIANKELDGRIAEVGSATKETVSSLVWTIVLGTVLVLVAFFGLLFGYRRLVARTATTATSH